MRLIGDIGGTNARFALADKGGNISEVKNFLKSDYYTVTDAIKAYKKIVNVSVDEVFLAVNAPIVNGRPHVNMNNWGYEEKSFEEAFGVKKVMFFNDLQAHAMSLPFLKEEDKIQINGKEANSKGVVAVVGPGTGLGLAYGIYDDGLQEHRFYSSEGGNQSAAAVDKGQLEVLGKVMDLLPSVRWEDLSSGRGIMRIYKALYNEDKSVEDIMKDFADGSSSSVKVFTLFCEFLGAFMHNVAITFLPEGGMYITGGILSRKENAEFLRESTKFLDYYNSQVLYTSAYLNDYPIYLITHFNPALVGLANY